METTQKYDAIVCGADLFQLEKAVRLAEEGKKVLVLTKSNVPGGEFVPFRRNQFEMTAADCGAEGQAAALACEKKLRGLGGEVRYKTGIMRVQKNADGSSAAGLTDGSRVFSGQIIPQPEGFPLYGKLPLRVVLQLNAPYENVKAAAERTENAAVFANDPTGKTCMLLLSGEMSRETFEALSEGSYFREKDHAAEAVIDAFEKAAGLKVRGRVLEADVVTPVTLVRQLVCAPSGRQAQPSLGDVLHPGIQFGKVLKVTDRGHAKSFVIGPDPERGTKSLAFFRAGQYISIQQPIGQAVVCKPYSVCSSPKDALGSENTSYTVMIERNPDGFFSPHALDTWKEGTKLVLSGPLGYAYHLPLRDAPHVVALAGSSGITPFYAMAAAIADGMEDFDLTILYGSRTADTILLRSELDELVSRSRGKVRVVHVLSDEAREGFEHGFITTDLIRKYAPDGDYSIFICGPQAMYEYLHRELPKLGLPEGRIRFELPGEFGDPAQDASYPQDAAGKCFTLTVLSHGKEKTIVCRSDQTLMQAVERAGIVIEAECRSGQCAWCRSLLRSGKVFVPESRDGRRTGDAGAGWVHPCVTYPLSDIVLEIYNH